MLRRLKLAVPVLVAYSLVALTGLASFHWFGVVWVAGGSMLPALAPGDVVIVRKGTALATGDIALMRPGSTLVLHRVIEVADDGSVRTRGDANPVADMNATQPAAVSGRVVRVLPIGAFLQRWQAKG